VSDQLEIHGIFDLTYANDYLTPCGLLVTRSGTTQALMGLSIASMLRSRSIRIASHQPLS
jgi:hypothetical protein